MIKYPQHIKKQCTILQFQDLESGKKNFEIKVNELQVEEGDYLTFTEVDEAGEPTGRSLTRRIASITKLDLPALTASKSPPEIVSLETPELGTLKTLFDNHFVVAFVIDKRESEWQIAEGPVHLPILVCPDLTQSGLLEELKIDSWPVGVYCVHLKLEPHIEGKDKPIVLDRKDTFILVMVKYDDYGTMVGSEVDWVGLVYGKCISPYGQTIDAAHPEEVMEAFIPKDMDDPVWTDSSEFEEKVLKDFEEGSKDGTEQPV